MILTHKEKWNVVVTECGMVIERPEFIDSSRPERLLTNDDSYLKDLDIFYEDLLIGTYNIDVYHLDSGKYINLLRFKELTMNYAVLNGIIKKGLVNKYPDLMCIPSGVGQRFMENAGFIQLRNNLYGGKRIDYYIQEGWIEVGEDNGIKFLGYKKQYMR